MAKAADTKVSAQKRVVGYFCEWGIYAAHDNYYVTDIPFEKLTHINYAFGQVNATFDGITVDRPENLKKITSQKGELKVLLSIGGWTSGGFSEMAASTEQRLSFAKDCKRIVDEFNLDGIDIDWEYPTSSAAGWLSLAGIVLVIMLAFSLVPMYLMFATSTKTSFAPRR